MSQQVKQSGETHADLREYHPLGRLRRIIRGYVLFEGILLALILACLWFWFTTALDYSLQHFADVDLLDSARPVRWIVAGIFTVFISAVVVWYIFRRLFRDFRADSLALILEKRFPELLGDRLITAVELADLKQAEKQGYSIEMIKLTMRDARKRVDQVPIRSVFNWRRLVLLCWTLVGVSALILVLTYPISVLFSLIEKQPSPTVWAMLIVNALLVLGILFLFFVPYLLGMLRKADSKLRWALLGLTALVVSSTAAGFILAESRLNTVQRDDYSWQLYHVANISLDRNLLFQETRWPKDEYFVDWLDFPVAEKRMKQKKAADGKSFYTLNSWAYFNTWTIADEKAPKRWRPVRWADLNKIVEATEIPELPLDRVHAYMVNLLRGDAASPVGYDITQLTLPNEDEITVDLVLAAVYDKDPKSRTFQDSEREPYANLVRKLTQKAQDKRFGGRVVRQIAPPGHMKLVYKKGESQSSSDSELVNKDDRRNVYSLKQALQLEDKITVHAEADVGGKVRQSSSRLVTMVHEPKLTNLAYQEFRPAYFYYMPPTAPRADDLDERRKLLRELRQPLREFRELNPAPSKTFNIAGGSELMILATADKKLQNVAISPRLINDLDPTKEEKPPVVKLQLQPDRKSFTIAFQESGKTFQEWENIQRQTAPVIGDPVFPSIKQTLSVKIEMKDEDNLSSILTYTITPGRDAIPEVNLTVDVIREVELIEVGEKNTIHKYKVLMCTPNATIPFNKNSSVSDDNGLHKVDFAYQHSPVENLALVSQRAEFAMWLWANTPILPTIGDFVFRREILLRTVSGTKAAGPTKGSTRVDPFYNEQARNLTDGLLTIDQLKEKLRHPLPPDYVSPLVKNFFFKDEDKQIYFDLQKLLPNLALKDPVTNAQKEHTLELDVHATDSNVLSVDRVGTNKGAPLTIRVAPEAVLHPYITKEESELAAIFDKMITDLEKTQRNLQDDMNRLPTLSPTTATSEKTRSDTIITEVAKARGLTSDIHEKYSRIVREYRVNRFPDTLTKGLDGKIIEPLKLVIAKEFSNAETELTKFNVILDQGRPELAQPLAGPVLDKMRELLDTLKQIRANMTDTVSINKTIVRLRSVVDGQIALGKEDYAKIFQIQTDKLLYTKLSGFPEEVSLTKGQTAKVKFKILMAETLTTDPVIRFEIPKDSGLKLSPAELKLKDDANEATFDITAGNQTGTYSLRLVPSQSKPGVFFDVKVVVK